MNLDDALREGMSMDGALGIAIVDYESGFTLAKQGGSSLLDLDVAGPALAEVVRAKLRAIETLQLDDDIEDILVTLGAHYHIIMPTEARGHGGSFTAGQRQTLFLYLVLDRSRGNLALARRHLRGIERRVRS
ncbi:hypothetical protein [Nocardia sp. NBC_01377]|uniref:hypothetical protein n=1 Tax=Nocardia sp. NBC_01377 TaxID=2903595 RepID=UPI003869C260